jgi:fructose-1,6-bisphosphatase II
VDCLYGIGGAPEGVLAAGAVRSLGGDMQARLMLRSDVKGKTPENMAIEQEEYRRASEMHAKIGKVYTLEEMVKTDNIIFSATGITKGDLLEGVYRNKDIYQTETLLIRGKTRTIRMIKTTHDLATKPEFLTSIINKK